MNTTTTPSAPDRASNLRLEDPATTRHRHRELAIELPAGVPAWTPDDGDPS